MPAFGRIFKALDADLKREQFIKDYKKALKNDALDPYTIYIFTNSYKDKFDISEDQLKKITPEWVIAKSYLTVGGD